MFFYYSGIVVDGCPILKNADAMVRRLKSTNRLADRRVINLESCEVASYDFNRLYPSLVQKDMVRRLKMLLKYIFTVVQSELVQNADEGDVFLAVEKFPACEEAVWCVGASLDEDPSKIRLDARKLTRYIKYIITNSFATFDGELYKLTRGLPAGTNMAPDLTNVYLVTYEMPYMHNLLQKWDELPNSLRVLAITYSRFIDDVFACRTDGLDLESQLYHDKHGAEGIFPTQLKDWDGNVLDNPLSVNGEPSQSCSYLDLEISVKNQRLRHVLYDKREHLFAGGKRLSELRNFPHVDTALSDSCKLAVITSQLHRFNRRTDDGANFVKITVHLAQKMIVEGYRKEDVIRKIVNYGRHWFGAEYMGPWPWVLRKILKKIKRWHVRFVK
jgi:hypothetical protein